MKTQKVVSKKAVEEMKKYSIMKTDACYAVDGKKYDIIKARVQNNLDDLAQDYLNEKYNQEALYEYRK